ncbi:MAG: hypothetical protein JXA20_13710 [Spirochaetes bacterium]|nr:hypothetical protein [Spirochaetota bacterium]
MANNNFTPDPRRLSRRTVHPVAYGTDHQNSQDYQIPQSIASSYLLQASHTRLSSLCDTGCFAVRLAEYIIETVTGNIFPVSDEGRFHDSFYRFIMKAIESTPLASEIEDRDLLLIYIKQAVAILRKARIIQNEEGVARIGERPLSGFAMYVKLFHSFWNDLEWEEIFSSDTALAADLKRNRYILMDLTLRHPGPMVLEALANDFFDLTGFSRQGDLFSISFLDFYFYTWLRHFGIVEYAAPRDDAPVSITVTDRGRKLLKAAM